MASNIIIDDPIDGVDEQLVANIENEGFQDGYERGIEDGQKEGQLLGEQEGARRGSELGYFHGYTLTYRQLLLSVNDKDVSREERVLSDLLKLIEDYPRTNETNCEEKLQTIRVKFRQAFGARDGRTPGDLCFSCLSD